ncbi:MAG: hypothetical protein HRU28_05505 [Rhizobiales bacterium]|nr:hypothetical protein [Hyphomicrobiales bacterium]
MEIIVIFAAVMQLAVYVILVILGIGLIKLISFKNAEYEGRAKSNISGNNSSDYGSVPINNNKKSKPVWEREADIAK